MMRELWSLPLIFLLAAANTHADWQGSGNPPWAAGQPDTSVGDCVTARSSDGLWQMADCNSRARTLCSDGNNWVLSNSTHQFTNTAIPACERQLGGSYVIAAPETNSDESTVRALITAQGEPVWLNIQYQSDRSAFAWNIDFREPSQPGGDLALYTWYDLLEVDSNSLVYKNKNWQEYATGSNVNLQNAIAHNRGTNAYFDEGEPNNSGDCVQLYSGTGAKAGLWDDNGCGNSKRVACYNGSDWAISPAATTLTAGSEFDSMQRGHDACSAVVDDKGLTGNYKFAAPVSFEQTMAVLQQAQLAGSGDVWININDIRYEDTFVYNTGMDVLAPFWGNGEPGNAGDSRDCAVQNTNGDWQDVSCSGSYTAACYNPFMGAEGDWRLAVDNGDDDLRRRCENIHGGEYQFAAPITRRQQQTLSALLSGSGAVMINASDGAQEGVWQLNQQVNSWDTAEPGSGQCVAVNAASGRWHSRSCSDVLPVACSSGSRWYFSTLTTDLTDFSHAADVCQQAFGSGYLFAATRTFDAASRLQYDARIAAAGSDYWINGQRFAGSWQWNTVAVEVPIWSGGQPDGGDVENCATLAANGDWSDEVCANVSRGYLCRNGNSWQITGNGVLQDFRQATQACEALGSGWRFAAPASLNDNSRAAAAISTAGGSPVWINASDKQDEDNWVINAAAVTGFPNWAAAQPDNGGVDIGSDSETTPGEDCVYQDGSGQWHDVSCLSSVSLPYACTDGNEWKVTTAEGIIRRFAEGHHACFVEYGGDFVFASPQSTDEVIKLDFARLTAAARRGANIDSVWLNQTDGGNEGQFVSNLPYQNWLLPDYPGQQPGVSCAYKSSVASGNNPWRLASCSQDAAHYACFNGSRWRVAISQGQLVEGQLQVVPQVGEDYWSYERGERLCKQQHGNEYFFAAPVTAVEEAALDAAIRKTPAQVKNTWLNLRYLSEVNSQHSRWFNNRINTTGWARPSFKNINNADCSMLHSDGSVTDGDCHASVDSLGTPLGFACFDGDWQVLANGGNDSWRAGFRRCQDELNAVFAVPRSPDELQALLAQMSSPVWINWTDTALESQWIANRERHSWWREGEPVNQNNRDCAVLDHSDGQWLAAKCDTEQRPFACRRLQGGSISWHVTASADIWSRGFAACQREYPGSEFYLPSGFGNVSASQSQQSLQAAATAVSRSVWLNFSDQQAEGNWRSYQVYSDWAVNSLFNENLDCGYFDRLASNGATWQMDACQYTPANVSDRAYACNNGYEWRLAPASSSGQLSWLEGFSACQNIGAEWRFSTPTSAVENAKLKLALELAGLSQAWVNAQDRVEEGNWWLNGDEVNFPPLIDIRLTSVRVDEQSNQVLHATLTDEEGLGIDVANWELIADSRYSNVADSDVVVSNINLVKNGASAVLTANYQAPRLLQQNIILLFKVSATDIAGGTASAASGEKTVTVTVMAPAIARYTFDDNANPGKDVTGNGHDAVNTSLNPLPAVHNQALVLTANDVMVVAGKQQDNSNGLELPAQEYTLAFRISIEQAGNGNWRGILQKGGDGSQQRQPALFLYPNNDIMQTNSSRDTNNDGSFDDNLVLDTPQPLLDRQWINVIYEKTATQLRLFIDGVEVGNLPASGIALANDGNLYIGNVPGAPQSFVGWIDDIQLYRRALSPAERGLVLPPPPIGEVSFTLTQQTVLEDAGSVAIQVERRRGSVDALNAEMHFIANDGTATLGNIAEVSSGAADLAFNSTGDSSLTVNWAAGERGVKSVNLALASSDDNQREGTETAVLRLPQSGTIADVSEPDTLRLHLEDVTPNPYGNFSAETLLTEPVLENNQATQQLCIWRRSGNEGSVTVNFQLTGTAQADIDYQVLNTGLPVVGGLGSAQFNQGAGLPESQCVDIQVINRSSNDSDRTLVLELMGLVAEAGKDPLLTDQDSATLIIRDWAPGEFNFANTSYSCKEPNTDATVPSELRPTVSELLCEVEVVRSKTGAFAPSASLTVAIDGSGSADGNDASPLTSLSWPEISPSSPINNADEIQTLQVNVSNDNVQETLEVLKLILAPVGAEVLGPNDMAEISITDVTSPSLVVLEPSLSDQASVAEGADVDIHIDRSLNSATEFTLSYQLAIDGLPIGKDIHDYIDFSNSSVGSTSGSLSFNASGSDRQTLTLRTLNTIEPNNGIDLILELLNPAPARVVGLGAITEANKGTPTDTRIRLAEASRLEDHVIVRLKDDGVVTEFLPGQFPSMPSYLVTNKDHSPARRKIDFEIEIPAGTGIEPDQIAYEWQLMTNSWFDGVATQSNGESLFTNRTGNASYNNTTGTVFSGTLLIPFVASVTTFDLQLVITGTGGSIAEQLNKQLSFNAVPVWRSLSLDNQDSDCLVSYGDGREPCSSQTRFLWNPDNRLMISQEAYLNGSSAYCFALPTSFAGDEPTYRNCNSSDSDQRATFGNSGVTDFRIDGDFVCGYIGGNINRLNLSSSCSNGDRRWVWRD